MVYVLKVLDTIVEEYIKYQNKLLCNSLAAVQNVWNFADEVITASYIFLNENLNFEPNFICSWVFLLPVQIVAWYWTGYMLDMFSGLTKFNLEIFVDFRNETHLYV